MQSNQGSFCHVNKAQIKSFYIDILWNTLVVDY